MKRINCTNCKHYIVTWDPDKPKGCKFFGFSSSMIPSQVVKQESGNDCESFEAKVPKEKDDSLDLNNDDLW